jgi:hypothetical protein
MSQPADDPFQEWGGRQNVEDAMGLMKAFESDGGVTALAVEALRAKGFDAADIHAFLSGEWVPGREVEEKADPFEGIADDDILTGADFKRLLGELLHEVDDRLEPVYQTQEEMEQAGRQHQADLAVAGTLQTLGVTDERKRMAVLKLAEQHLDPEDWDPRNIAAAVQAGYADLVALTEGEKQQYVGEKRRNRDTLPRGLGGSSSVAGGGDAPEAEPKDLKEAILRARKSLGL